MTLVDEILAEQQSLTAVERFSRYHERHSERPEFAPHYQSLIPLSQPGADEQYAFEVDLQSCSGCKACVSACHHLNGLDPGESWRDVGLLLGQSPDAMAMQQIVTTACHHCVEPACAHGCPTLAYEKEASTGVVRHLDDQCMGCRYCELKCPYEVPRFNSRLGIVRKCDMCQSRLSAGEAPACVQACPNEAITIRIVSQAEVPDSGSMVPGAFDSAYTRPATLFKNLSEKASLRPADEGLIKPAHVHFPLAWMLTLVPMSVGMMTTFWLGDHTDFRALVVATLTGWLGLTGSVLHLGRPSQAWRAFLGWRRSWLSREIIVFNLWSVASALTLGSVFLGLPKWISVALGSGAALLGLVGLGSSVAVYADTKRSFWRARATFFRFFATAVVAGAVFMGKPFAAAIMLAALLAWEATILWYPNPKDEYSSHVMLGPLAKLTSLRFLTAAATLIAFFTGSGGVLIALALLGITELAARCLFFMAVDEPSMPGTL